ncbi:MAG: hypothetical protein RPT25_07035 [Cycloclasticus sp.]
MDEAMRLADLMANSDMVPKDFRGKPGNILIAVQMGAEVGLPPMQAIQNIAVINGRPALWGDAVKAVVLASPLCEKFEEGFDDANMTAWVVVKRKGHAERTITFSQADAEAANLWEKQGPWKQYPKRMLQMRARGFAARDEFADVLKGLSVAEEAQEAQDIPQEKEINATPAAEQVTTTAFPHYLDENFTANLPKWVVAINAGKITLEQAISRAESKAKLSDNQINQLKNAVSQEIAQ